MSEYHEDDVEEILLAFAVESEHDRATLERYLRHYPHLAEELVDLSLDLRLRQAKEGTSAPPDELWVERSWAAFQAGSSTRTLAPASDPFDALSSEELVALRQALDVPSGVIQGFRSRLVDIASVPAWFVGAMAGGLRTGVDDLRSFMAAPQRLSPGVSYKSDDAPAVDDTKITFGELLEQCRVPEDKRQRLLARRD